MNKPTDGILSPPLEFLENAVRRPTAEDISFSSYHLCYLAGGLEYSRSCGSRAIRV